MPKQITPSAEIVQTFINGVAQATLEQVASEVDRKLKLSVEVWEEDSGRKFGDLDVGVADKPVVGTLRMRFREAFGGRYLMFSELMFDENEDVGGCSGCSFKADLRPGNDAKRTAWTMRHNVRKWTGWI